MKNAYEIATRTGDAYSRPKYRAGAWLKIIRTLLAMGYSSEAVEYIMRSTFTRHAHDVSGKEFCPASIAIKYIKANAGMVHAMLRDAGIEATIYSDLGQSEPSYW